MAIKTSKDSDPSEEVFATCFGNEDSNINVEEMSLLAQRFTNFFRKKKPFSRGIRKSNSSSKGLKSVKVVDDSDNESEKPNKIHLIKIKCF